MEDVAGQLVALSALVTPLLVTWGLKLLGALAIFVIGRMVAKSVRKSVGRFTDRSDMDATLAGFLSSLAYYVVLVVVIVAALATLGIQMASVLTILGAAGLAVGLALQGTLSNVSAGVMLLIFRPFKVGDVVEVGGTLGKVEAIGLFETKLNTPDNVHIIVPNSTIYGDTIQNYSRNDDRRIDLVVGISYDDDISLAVKTINDVLTAESRVSRDPAPQVAVSEMADSSVNLVVRPWCKADDYWNVRFDVTRALKEKLEVAGCSIPYPQQDVHMHQAS